MKENQQHKLIFGFTLHYLVSFKQPFTTYRHIYVHVLTRISGFNVSILNHKNVNLSKHVDISEIFLTLLVAPIITTISDCCFALNVSAAMIWSIEPDAIDDEKERTEAPFLCV